MGNIPIGSAYDGPQYTVNSLIGQPTLIASKIKELLENQFIGETLLRNAGGNTNGLVQYSEGDPLFLIDDPKGLAEFGEIPISLSGVGTPLIAQAVKIGLGIRVSYEMRTENNIDHVNRQLSALKNTFIRSNDRVIRALFDSPEVQTLAASTAWDAAGSKPRSELLAAKRMVATAKPTDATADEAFGFKADTLVVNPGMLDVLMDNDQFEKAYQGNLASESLLYTGALPGQLYGLNVLQSYSMPEDEALVLQRGVVGFYSDTRPLSITPLYGEGGGPNGGPRETFRADAVQKRAVALDQPKAAVRLTGLVA